MQFSTGIFFNSTLSGFFLKRVKVEDEIARDWFRLMLASQTRDAQVAR